tara:strand:+ start:4779 stop:5264 length:486 start_codon:yes stop_codon:yes gene_type:complete
MIKVALSLRRPATRHESSIATTRRRTTARRRFSVKASSSNDDDVNDEAKIVAENERFFNERMASKDDEMELDRRRSTLEDMLLVSQKEDDEEKNVWKTKPFWCQPWTIVLTGVGIISLPTIVFDWKAVSGVFVVPIAAWWYIFLYAYPKSYRENNGMEEYE